MLITFFVSTFHRKIWGFLSTKSRQNVRTGLVAKIWASLAIVVLKVVASCAFPGSQGMVDFLVGDGVMGFLDWTGRNDGFWESWDVNCCLYFQSFVNLDELRCCYKWSHRICFDEEIPMRPLFGTDAWTPGLLDLHGNRSLPVTLFRDRTRSLFVDNFC